MWAVKRHVRRKLKHRRPERLNERRLWKTSTKKRTEFLGFVVPGIVLSVPLNNYRAFDFG